MVLRCSVTSVVVAQSVVGLSPLREVLVGSMGFITRVVGAPGVAVLV